MTRNVAVSDSAGPLEDMSDNPSLSITYQSDDEVLIVPQLAEVSMGAVNYAHYLVDAIKVARRS